MKLKNGLDESQEPKLYALLLHAVEKFPKMLTPLRNQCKVIGILDGWKMRLEVADSPVDYRPGIEPHKHIIVDEKTLDSPVQL